MNSNFIPYFSKNSKSRASNLEFSENITFPYDSQTWVALEEKLFHIVPLKRTLGFPVQKELLECYPHLPETSWSKKTKLPK